MPKKQSPTPAVYECGCPIEDPAYTRCPVHLEYPYQDVCPNCGTDFDGGPIPDEMHQHYAPPWRWSSKMAIFSAQKSMPVVYKCPLCHYVWPVRPMLVQELEYWRKFTLEKASGSD